MSGGARDDYARRMHAVLAHIDQHLDQPLDLPRLAAVAHFSPFHFHRLFAAWTGERLGDYLRRRRLERAAAMLAFQPRVPVTQVALGVGFGSGEAFARAFKLQFGCSPSVWRTTRAADRKIDQADRNVDQAPPGAPAHHRASHAASVETPMNVQLIERPEVTVAYLRRTGAYGPAVGAFWMDTVAPWMAQHGLMGRARYGISHDDPSITAPARCRYDACVEVDAALSVLKPALKTQIPGGRYAVMPYEGTSAQIGQAWARLLGQWLPDSRLQLDLRPCFEHYPADARFDPATGAFSCELCIPVAPL